MRIGIGCGADTKKVMQCAAEITASEFDVICYAKEGTKVSVPDSPHISVFYSACPEKSLVDDLYEKRIDAAVRGSLPANDTLKYLKSVYGVSRLERICLLETPAGEKFFFAPVGVDEGWTVEEKVSFVRDGLRLAKEFGLPEKATILSGGRLGDVGRHEAVDKTICDAEKAARISGAVHGEILIEDAVKESGVIVAPDGISGNLIFRTLVFLGTGKSRGAPIVNIPDVFIDSSRASTHYAEILRVAARFVAGKTQ